MQRKRKAHRERKKERERERERLRNVRYVCRREMWHKTGGRLR